MQILTNAAATAVGYAKLEFVDWVTIDVQGDDWDTDGTVTVGYSKDGGTTWITNFMPAGATKVYTAGDANDLLHWGNCILRFTVGGGSGSVDVNVWVAGGNVVKYTA